MTFKKKEALIEQFIETVSAAESADKVWDVGLKPFLKRTGLQLAGLVCLGVGWAMFCDNCDISSQQYGAMKAIAKSKE